LQIDAPKYPVRHGYST